MQLTFKMFIYILLILSARFLFSLWDYPLKVHFLFLKKAFMANGLKIFSASKNKHVSFEQHS